jgi:hypothetical protein
MSTPTPAEIHKAQIIVEYVATRDAAVAAAAHLIAVANSVQGMVTRAHYVNASQDLADAAAVVVETLKRAAVGRDNLWAVEAAEKRAAATAERVAYVADTKADNAAYEAARRAAAGADLSDDDLSDK